MQRSYHGDYLVEVDLAEQLACLLAVDDGEPGPGGSRYSVSAATMAVSDRVSFLSLPDHDVAVTQRAEPLEFLRLATSFPAPAGQARVRQVVEQFETDRQSVRPGRESLERLWRLVDVSWGTPVQWRPAADSIRQGPTLNVGAWLLISGAAPSAMVPDLVAARLHLAASDVLPGGARGQALMKRGYDWPSVPRVSDWTSAQADPWVVPGLLENSCSTLGDSGGGGIERIALVPDGSEVVALVTRHGRLDRASIITLWEGLDSNGTLVAVAAIKAGFAEHRERPLPIWPPAEGSTPLDAWAGDTLREVTRFEDPDGQEPPEVWEDEYRLALVEVGRLRFPSTRIVTADPCVATRTRPLNLVVDRNERYPVYLAQLLEGFDDQFISGEMNGLLVVLEELRPPVRWVAGRDDAGHELEGGIDTGTLGIFDHQAAAWLESERLSPRLDGGWAPVTLARSQADQPADIALLTYLGGDGPSWTTVGLDAADMPVAVLVSNYNLLELATGPAEVDT